MSTLKVELGTTLNIGNFSNIKVTVGMEEDIDVGRFEQHKILHDNVQDMLLDSIDRLLDKFEEIEIPVEVAHVR